MVDPALKGKVKITVIATGFGAPAAARPSASAQTPIDMTHYSDHGRMRPEPLPAPSSVAASRFSFARRPLLELPLAAGMASAPAAPPTTPAAPAGAADDDTVVMRAPTDTDGVAPDPDFDLSSTFDVPAFLRRQEG